MDPNTQRAESERWLGIAAKLLTARDFLGSKTFAIRARDSDPNNVISDQILAVVDTLIAAEKKINNQYDWYGILQLAHLARDPEVIGAQYRRLVFLLNPDRNGLPFADYALRLVVDAWSVLSDTTKKWLYDSELSLYLQQLDSRRQRVDPAQLNTFQFFQQPQQQSQAPLPPQPQPERVAEALQPQWQQRQQRELEERDQQQQSIQFRALQQPQPQPQPNAWQLLRQEHQRQQEQRQQRPEQQHQQRQPLLEPRQQKEQEHREFLQPQRGPPTQSESQPQPQPQWLLRREQQSIEQQLQGNERQRNEDNGGGNERPTVSIASVGDGDANENIEVASFWTACPYCFYIYEYPETYMDYTLRCQNCRRAFHAAQIPNPPPIGNGRDSGVDSFCCWGFFPLGFSMTRWKKSNQMGNKNAFLNWVPFSPMFACPVNGNGNVAGYHFNAAGGSKTVGRKARGRSPGPRVYVDDDDIFDGVSESGDDSDSSDDWGRSSRKKKKKKKKKNGKRRGRPRKAIVLREKKGNQNVVAEGGGDGGENLQGRNETQEAAIPVSAVGAKADANKKAGSSNSRKQSGKVVKDRGKLDLNVEFSNEVEDHAPTMSAGNGQEEAIEGIAFFEGLDEFLSSLPILNVVGDEKAKPS